MATGEFCGLLDHDDLLSLNALEVVVRALNENPEFDFIYSDEDYLLADGSQRVSPFFKPDFDLDLLRLQNYICHFSVIRTKILHEVGGFSEGLEGSQDHDLFLRVVDSVSESRIKHISKILYHWRIWSQSVASGAGAKPYTFIAARKAVLRHLGRRKEIGRLGSLSGAWHPVIYQARDSEVFQIFWDLRSVPENKIESIIKSFLRSHTHEIWAITVLVNTEIAPISLQDSATVQTLFSSPSDSWQKAFQNSPLKSSDRPVWIISGDLDFEGDEHFTSAYKRVEHSSIGAIAPAFANSSRRYLQVGYLITKTGWLGARFENEPIGSFGHFGRLTGIHQVSAIQWNGSLFHSGLFLSQLLETIDSRLATLNALNIEFVNRDAIVNLALSLEISRLGLKLLVNPLAILIDRNPASSISTHFSEEEWLSLLKVFQDSIPDIDPFYHPMLSQDPAFFDLRRN